MLSHCHCQQPHIMAARAKLHTAGAVRASPQASQIIQATLTQPPGYVYRQRRNPNGKEGKRVLRNNTFSPTLPSPLKARNYVSTSTFLSERHESVLRHFPSALGVDDFIARVETALCGYGFTGENSIGQYKALLPALPWDHKDLLGLQRTCYLPGCQPPLQRSCHCSCCSRQLLAWLVAVEYRSGLPVYVAVLCRPPRQPLHTHTIHTQEPVAGLLFVRLKLTWCCVCCSYDQPVP